MDPEIPGIRSTSSASTIYELLSRASAANPAGTAITYLEDADTFSTSKLTHAEFIARLHQMAHFFHELGIGRTDVVSILSPNVPDALVAFFAAETVGIANPINFLLRPEEVEAIMRTVESKMIVTIGPEAPDLWSKVEYLRKRVPSLAHIVAIGAASADAISLRTALGGRPTAPPSTDLLPRAEDVAAYFHTGGTTGSPKVAQHLHRNQVFSAEALADSWQFDKTTLTEEHFDKLFDLNVKGTLFTVQKALPLMNDGGSIILIGSVASVKGTASFGTYGATKAAVRNLVRTWTVELKDRRIRSNVLSPGPIKTPLVDLQPPEAIARILATIPMGRMGEPDEVAKAAVFLASDDSSFVTGIELFVDGGRGQV
jgi:NAD(P)-dependent dehydrogenase (short-subunit alcohol dehydrogenase family)